MTEIVSVENHGGDGVFKYHTFVNYNETTKIYDVKLTSTYSASKYPDEHYVKAQLFLNQEQYDTLINILIKNKK